jgi:putative oxidoreductase
VNRSDDMACLVGRLFIAALLLPAGLQKLMHFSKFAASVASKGLPFPKLWAMLDVAIEVLGPIALIIGLWPRWTALVLVVLTVVTTWATYRFGVFTAIFRQPQPVQLMKSLAVIAGLLFYFASGTWGLGGGSERACGEVRPHRRGASGL